MGDGSGGDDRLKDLEVRIKAARDAHLGPKRAAGEEYTLGSLAWRMVTELVVGVLVGGFIGWGLDSLFGTLPVFVIVMGLFGFAAGVRLVMRAAEEVRRTDAGGRRHGATGPGHREDRDEGA